MSRLSGVGLTDVLDPMATYGAAGDTAAVEAMGKKLGGQVKGAGFNVDFAPVADIVTNPNNTEIGDRSFSSDPAVASDMVAAMTRGLQEGGVLACLKHFPGHGSTEADSHLGTSVTSRTLDELREAELLPFRRRDRGGRGHDHGLAYVRPGRHGRQHALRPLPRRCDGPAAHGAGL